MKHKDNRKTALVAGGAGFVGSHLCDRLISEGYRVICLDNLYTGSLSNIEHLQGSSLFEFIEQDVIIPFQRTGLSMIFNLACPASPRHYQKDPIYTTKISVLGALNLLELARMNDCPILQASTSEVYGDPLVHPQAENYYGNVNPVGPRACYDEGKRCAESLFMDYHRQYGTKIKIVRIFNTYGPRMAEDDGRVISNFVTQALKGHPITINGDGSQTRSFMFVSDLIDGLIRMICTPEDFTGPINLGNPEEYTIRELADIVVEKICINANFENYTLPQNDPKLRRPDISLAKEKLHWDPAINASKGLDNTIDFFKKKYEN